MKNRDHLMAGQLFDGKTKHVVFSVINGHDVHRIFHELRVVPVFLKNDNITNLGKRPNGGRAKIEIGKQVAIAEPSGNRVRPQSARQRRWVEDRTQE